MSDNGSSCDGMVIMSRYPVIDTGRCSNCKGCIEIAPHIFAFNVDMGMMQVIDLPEYDEQLVEEAMKNCPEDCIYWEKQ